jgi:hypothetical protein
MADGRARSNSAEGYYGYVVASGGAAELGDGFYHSVDQGGGGDSGVFAEEGGQVGVSEFVSVLDSCFGHSVGEDEEGVAAG